MSSKPLSVDEALAQVLPGLKTAVGIETIPVAAALGRVLAVDVIAQAYVPPHDNSAMDGFAFARDSVSDAPVPVIGTIAAGHPFDGVVQAGQAIKILTGAVVPVGVDTIAMIEDCVVGDGIVTIPASIKLGANLRKKGEDITAGNVVLRAGQRLRAQDLGLASAAGQTHLQVYQPLRVAIFSTGDEIYEPGTALGAGGVYDTNRTTVRAMLENLGASVTDLGILPDDHDVIVSNLSNAAQNHHMILTSGGVSMGDEDHVKAAVLALGSLEFWRLAIKPGRPLALGQVSGVPFVGLPGNPVAVMVTFLMIAREMIIRLQGRTPQPILRLPVASGFDLKHKPGRREWLRGQIRLEDGRLVAEKFHTDGSGVLSSMVWASGLIELSEHLGDIKMGDGLFFIPWEQVQA